MLILGNGTLIFHYALVRVNFFRNTFVYTHRGVTVAQPVVVYVLEEVLTITELL